MTVDKTELYKLYMEWVDKVADECEWKTYFGPKEIVYTIAKILEEHPELINNKEFETVTEESLLKMKNKWYGGGKELKVGDKIIFGFTNNYANVNGTPPSTVLENNVSMTLNVFVLDENQNMLIQLYSKS
jgi:hypothetical protein